MTRADDPWGTGDNAAFELAEERILAARGAAMVRASVTVTKANQRQHQPPVNGSLQRGAERDLDEAQIRPERRDVHAYLHGSGEGAALALYEAAFSTCTLLCVLAVGSAPAESDEHRLRFHRGVRPRRVLEPLIAILAMTGVLTGPEAEKVGAP